MRTPSECKIGLRVSVGTAQEIAAKFSQPGRKVELVSEGFMISFPIHGNRFALETQIAEFYKIIPNQKKTHYITVWKNGRCKLYSHRADGMYIWRTHHEGPIHRLSGPAMTGWYLWGHIYPEWESLINGGLDEATAYLERTGFAQPVITLANYGVLKVPRTFIENAKLIYNVV